MVEARVSVLFSCPIAARACGAILDAALDVVRQVLADLGVTDGELTGELYTDAVRAEQAS